jgi:hypothetical protein
VCCDFLNAISDSNLVTIIWCVLAISVVLDISVTFSSIYMNL